MSKPSKHTFVLAMEDQGAALRDSDGGLILALPGVAAGPQRRAEWGAALRGVIPRGSELRVLLGQSSLTVTCQDAPFLGASELKDTARRMGAAEGAGTAATAAAQDVDPGAEGGHTLWIASLPSREMHDLVALAEDLDLRFTLATPWARVLQRGLESTPDQPRDRMVLAVDEGQGRLCVFRGPGLLLQRAFRLPEDEDEESRLERVVQELARTLQFVKQRQRNIAVDHLLLVGMEAPSAPFLDRLKGLRLKAHEGPAELWPVLWRGLERERKGGLNLVPVEVLEAQTRKVARLVLWVASFLVLGLMGTMWAWLRWSVDQRARDADQMEATLAQRKALQAQRHEVVGARVPLLRLRMAEARQVKAGQALGRLGALLLEAPEGVSLEKVEVLQAPGEPLKHRFLVTGTALTEPSFSAGPLSLYLARLQAHPGLVLQPMREVQVLDRREENDSKIDQRAVARFRLEGSAP